VDAELRMSLQRALRQQALLAENQTLRRQLDARYGLGSIIGADARMQKVYELIEAVAPSRTTVLMTGESGTGKSLIAHAIHQASPRRGKPFVELSCGSIPETLLESELFGHVKGAFTGAHADKIGRFLAADGGTIFLDEINSASPAMQLKLLRVLQERRFEPVGSSKTVEIDVRVVLASNQPLETLVADGRFRQDLYYRINVFPMHMPPLRERPDDIALLVHHFVQKYRARLGKPVEGVTPGALARLAAYEFPGNVRELENKIHQAMVVAGGQHIEDADIALPAPGPNTAGRVDVTRPFRDVKQETIDAFESAYLTELLRVHKGNLAQAARAAGMDRKNLWALAVRHGLDRARFKKP
jgi:DNA-binding NtrC family response regulator